MNLDNIHKGKYIPKNPDKYLGDVNDITFRSSWERFMMLWCDSNPDILMWGSEVTQIKYICETDKKTHTYYVDFTIKFKSGKLYLIEIKPEKYTSPPKKVGKSKQTFLTESVQWAKNKSKWTYAMQYAKENGFIFEVWTEKKLQRIGLR